MSEALAALMVQDIKHAELAVRQAENGVLDAAPAKLELQGLTSRLAAQQQHLASTRHEQELQGNAASSLCACYLVTQTPCRYLAYPVA